MNRQRLRNNLKIRLTTGLRKSRNWGTPATIFLEVTNRCNIECIMCLQTQDPRYHEDPSFVGHMDPEIVEKLAKTYPGSSFVCTFGIGEPLLNRGIYDIFATIKRNRGRIAMTCNGTVLKPPIIERILDHHVDRIIFSIDGTTAEVFESIRHKADFQEIWGNVKSFCRRKRERKLVLPEVNLEFVAMARNFHQLPDLVEMAADIKADSIIVQPLYVNEFEVAQQRMANDRLEKIPLREAKEIWQRTLTAARAASMPIVSPLQEAPLEDFFFTNRQPAKGQAPGAKETPATPDLVQIEIPHSVPVEQQLDGRLDLPLEKTVNGTVRFAGWAINRSDLGEAVTVEIIQNGKNLYQANCDVSRPDVGSALRYADDSRPCGFDCNITAKGEGQAIQVVVRSGDYRRTLGEVQVGGSRRVFLGDFWRWFKSWGNGNRQAMFCDQPWSVIHVSRHGLVRTCCENETVFGDLSKEDFGAIWNGKSYRQFRENVRDGVMDEQCRRCVQGGFHRSLRAPNVGWRDALSAFGPDTLQD